MQVLFGMRKISNFAIAKGTNPKRTYFDESVFALFSIENVEVFKCKRTTNSTHFLFRLRTSIYSVCRYPVYSSVGYRVVYSYTGLSTTFYRINEIQLHTFLL